MCDKSATIAAKWQEVLDKCFMFAAAWSCSGIGSGVGVSTLTAGLSPNRVPIRTPPHVPAVKREDAFGGTIVEVENSPYLIVQKGDKTFHISPDRVKEYVKNPLNPKSRWGDQVDFKKYGVPEGSEIIQGAGKGHKRTPTADELRMFNGYFKK